MRLIVFVVIVLLTSGLATPAHAQDDGQWTSINHGGRSMTYGQINLSDSDAAWIVVFRKRPNHEGELEARRMYLTADCAAGTIERGAFINSVEPGGEVIRSGTFHGRVSVYGQLSLSLTPIYTWLCEAGGGPYGYGGLEFTYSEVVAHATFWLNQPN